MRFMLQDRHTHYTDKTTYTQTYNYGKNSPTKLYSMIINYECLICLK